jgi:hypothetical protein
MRATTSPPGAGELGVEPAKGGFRLVNPDTSEAFFIAFEQGATALVNWRPWVDSPPAAWWRPVQRTLPFDSIPGYQPAADSAVVFGGALAAGGGVGVRQRPDRHGRLSVGGG